MRILYGKLMQRSCVLMKKIVEYLTNLWYSLIRIEEVEEVFNMPSMVMKSIYEKTFDTLGDEVTVGKK